MPIDWNDAVCSGANYRLQQFLLEPATKIYSIQVLPIERLFESIPEENSLRRAEIRYCVTTVTDFSALIYDAESSNNKRFM